MTLEQLQTKLEEIEALTQSGKDYALAETQARLLLAEEGIENVPDLHCKVLLALSASLWSRGYAQDALPFAEKALGLAVNSDNKKLTARTLFNIGNVYKGLSEFHRALEYDFQALALYEELGENQNIGLITGNIGLIYNKLQDYSRALEYHRKALAIHEEFNNKKAMAGAIHNIGGVYADLRDYALALEHYSQALSINTEIGNKDWAGHNLYCTGNVYMNLYDYSRALEYNQKALFLYEEVGNKLGVAFITSTIANVFSNLSDYSRSLEYNEKALALYEELGNKQGVALCTGNVGLVYNERSDYSQALEYLHQARTLDEALDNKSGVARHTGHIGNAYKGLYDFSNALECYQKALSICEELNDTLGMANWICSIGQVYAEKKFEGYDLKKAEEFTLQGGAIFEESGNKKGLYLLHESLTEIYEKQGRKSEAFDHIKKYHELKDEVQSEAAKKKAEQMDYERKKAEREKQLAVERAEAATVKRILHNTLPPIIADRLINNETFIADSYPNVSVLFMDLVNFTRIAAIIPPRHLIYLLNTIFSNADAVMEKHGLEKIKTIGDAYMAVAGAPVHQDDHAQRAALAAIEVMEAMNNLQITIPQELGETSWTEQVGEIQVRIGLHCGEAIGGVIGDKKFTFDLWGDAVNTAARMESHGEAGKIHCTEEFMHSVETLHATSLQFIERGEIDIKGKGMMKTYFLERTAIPS
ncbi:MAG: adenylate/guanylate cyclase domain-containing protein [Candidatus Kapaibacterium sp.]